jgi:hypothetical protein
MPNTYSLNQADENILHSFILYPYLTIDQITRLHYKKGSATYVSTKLKTLAYQKYLFRPHRLSATIPYVYCLGIRGVRFLRTQGVDVAFHPSEHESLSYPFLQHTLAVNEFLLAASQLPRFNPSLTLFEMKHDATLKRMLKGVIPDGWMDFRIGRTQQCIWLELDRGTMEQKRFRRKIANLLAFAMHGYEEVFGTPSLTIAFATTAGEHRLKNIIKWTQQELTARKKTEEADLFRFTTVPTHELDPTWLFCQPIWYCPFATDTVSLLVS